MNADKRPQSRARGFKACTLVWYLIALTFGQVAFAQAQPKGFEEDFDDEFKPWTEIEARMPALPLTDALEPLDVSIAASQRFALDRNSLSIDRDGVVRYTLVITSLQGARNISYEGIRCSTRERKLYAFGRPDGTWSRSRRNVWDRIREAERNRQHAVLYSAFCEASLPVADIKSILHRLRTSPPVLP